MREAHKIYDLVDKEFRNFVLNNRKILEKMQTGSVVETYKCECKPYIMKIFDIQYVGKYNGEDGHYYAFLDSRFSLLYTYYNVE